MTVMVGRVITQPTRHDAAHGPEIVAVIQNAKWSYVWNSRRTESGKRKIESKGRLSAFRYPFSDVAFGFDSLHGFS